MRRKEIDNFLSISNSRLVSRPKSRSPIKIPFENILNRNERKETAKSRRSNVLINIYLRNSAKKLCGKIIC